MTTPAPARPASRGNTWPAVTGFVLAFFGALVAAVNGHEEVDDMGWQGWLIVFATGLVTAVGVYVTPNPVVGRRGVS